MFMSSDHRDIRTIRFFLHLKNQKFAPSLALLKHELNKRGFIFGGIQRWPEIENVVGFRKLRSFQGTQVNLSVLLEKLEIT